MINFFNKIKNKESWALKIAHFFTVEVIGITLMFVEVVRKKIRFGLGTNHSLKEHFIIAPLYCLALSFISVFYAAKAGLLYRWLPLLISLVIDLVLIKLRVFKIKRKDYREYFMVHVLTEGLSRYFYYFINKQNKNGQT